jgi:hypothetical protein
MPKKVEHKGKKYKVSWISYAFTKCRLVINGVPSEIIMLQEDLTDVESYKLYAKRAIESYDTRKSSEKAFNDWDGKL